MELARPPRPRSSPSCAGWRDFQARHAAEAAGHARAPAATRVIDDGNTFEVLMDAVRVCSLGEITQALYEVGGHYRRNM